MGERREMLSTMNRLICVMAIVSCAALVASAEPEDFVPEAYTNQPNSEVETTFVEASSDRSGKKLAVIRCMRNRKCRARMVRHRRFILHKLRRAMREKRMKHHVENRKKLMMDGRRGRHVERTRKIALHFAWLKKCRKSKKCWAAHMKRLAARKKHIACMKNKKCRAKWIAAHKKRVAAWRKKRRAAHEKMAKHYHKKRRAMHEKRIKAHKRRYAAYLKKCRKSRKCWAVHLRMKAHRMRRAAHEKRAKHYHKKRHAMHEKSLKANKKRHAAHEKRVKHYHNKRRAMHEKRMKQSKKGAFPVVYQHCNFGGYHRTIKRSVNWVHKLKIKNDDLSGIKVPAGKCVRLYEHINYKGRSWTICGKKSITCFVNHTMKPGKSWNDQVSSITVFNKPQMKRRL